MAPLAAPAVAPFAEQPSLRDPSRLRVPAVKEQGLRRDHDALLPNVDEHSGVRMQPVDLLPSAHPLDDRLREATRELGLDGLAAPYLQLRPQRVLSLLHAVREHQPDRERRELELPRREIIFAVTLPGAPISPRR